MACKNPRLKHALATAQKLATLLGQMADEGTTNPSPPLAGDTLGARIVAARKAAGLKVRPGSLIDNL